MEDGKGGLVVAPLLLLALTGIRAGGLVLILTIRRERHRLFDFVGHVP